MKEEVKVHVYYLRGSNHTPYGTIVITQSGKVGVALCHTGLDQFDRRRGVRIAYGRAIHGRITHQMPDIQGYVREEVIESVSRLHEIQKIGKLPLNYTIPGDWS